MQWRIQYFPWGTNFRGGSANLLFCKLFCRKPHGNEIIWTERVQCPWRPLLGLATAMSNLEMNDL